MMSLPRRTGPQTLYIRKVIFAAAKGAHSRIPGFDTDPSHHYGYTHQTTSVETEYGENLTGASDPPSVAFATLMYLYENNLKLEGVQIFFTLANGQPEYVRVRNSGFQRIVPYTEAERNEFWEALYEMDEEIQQVGFAKFREGVYA